MAYNNNEFDSGAVINCLDFNDSRTNAQLRLDAQTFATNAPVFGPHTLPIADSPVDTSSSHNQELQSQN
jgi:hypothetical protein